MAAVPLLAVVPLAFCRSRSAGLILSRSSTPALSLATMCRGMAAVILVLLMTGRQLAGLLEQSAGAPFTGHGYPTLIHPMPGCKGLLAIMWVLLSARQLYIKILGVSPLMLVITNSHFWWLMISVQLVLGTRPLY